MKVISESKFSLVVKVVMESSLLLIGKRSEMTLYSVTGLVFYFSVVLVEGRPIILSNDGVISRFTSITL